MKYEGTSIRFHSLSDELKELQRKAGEKLDKFSETLKDIRDQKAEIEKDPEKRRFTGSALEKLIPE